MINGQHRNPNMNNKDHLVGQLTNSELFFLWDTNMSLLSRVGVYTWHNCEDKTVVCNDECRFQTIFISCCWLNDDWQILPLTFANICISSFASSLLVSSCSQSYKLCPLLPSRRSATRSFCLKTPWYWSPHHWCALSAIFLRLQLCQSMDIASPVQHGKLSSDDLIFRLTKWSLPRSRKLAFNLFCVLMF